MVKPSPVVAEAARIVALGLSRCELRAEHDREKQPQGWRAYGGQCAGCVLARLHRSTFHFSAINALPPATTAQTQGIFTLV